MSHEPPYKKPGNRSAVGSGIDESAFPKLDKPMGQLTPPGFVEFPTGAREVSFSSGASTPTVADGKARREFSMM
jgi:hypothetical protein